MPVCRNCGLDLKTGDKYCARCGEQASTTKCDPTPVRANTRGLLTRRVIAGIIDYGIIAAIIVLLLRRKNVIALLVVRRFAIGGLLLLGPFLYFLFKDCFGGKSIGKLLTGITVYSPKHGQVASAWSCMLRNRFLALPILGPTIFALTTGIQVLLGKEQRLGDKEAGTCVIADEDLPRLRDYDSTPNPRPPAERQIDV